MRDSSLLSYNNSSISICIACVFAIVDILKRHKINSIREREIFFLVYWNGDEATRYTCTFFNKSLNFHAPQPYHSSAFSIIISLLFYSLFAVCLSACFFTVFDALSIAPPPPLPPFWHGTLSTTNHQSDKKMRDEISSIMPKLSRWIWKKGICTISERTISAWRSIHFYSAVVPFMICSIPLEFLFAQHYIDAELIFPICSSFFNLFINML